MNKRRTTIIALLLVAALALGIGYAVNSVSFDIDGRAEYTAMQKDFAIKFTNATALDEDIATGSISSDFLATISVFGLRAKDQSTTVTYTITNDTTSVYDAKLKELSIPNADTEYFKIEVENAAALEGTILEPGDSYDVVVKVTLKKSVMETASADIDIALVAEPVVID